jgi:IMP and pyridine-specific 5'-nucleotidase
MSSKSLTDRYQVEHQNALKPRSKLSMLVPTIGMFFTPLALEAAFLHQDAIRAISSRRFVPPSFNDIRLILNTAQIMSLMCPSPTPQSSSPGLKLLTFDGDVTLYEDCGSLTSDSPVISRLLHFLGKDVKIGIVTAAGYTDSSKYFARLSGLIEAVQCSQDLTAEQKRGLIIMGGESNFLFVFDEKAEHCLRYVHRRDWILPVMHAWSEPAIQSLLSVAESAFRGCIATLRLPAEILRKERAVGIYPKLGCKFTREQLEETVLVVQQVVEMAPEVIEGGIPFCAFNGGNDVFVDIGDKSLGVQGCQKWFGGVKAANTLHVGDQFLSGGGNDFKARSACTTAWIASPAETVILLDEMIAFAEK